MSNTTVKTEFGTFIRAERVKAGLSLRALAKELEISAVYLGEVERGVRPPLKESHWDKLLKYLPSVDRSTLQRLTLKSKPIQLDLRDSPPEYQDLGHALARRIEKKDISQIDIDRLFRILGDNNE